MLTREEATKLWSYNSVTGIITRLSDGHIYKSKTYILIKHKGLTIRGHHLAWFLHYGYWPKDQVDHINRKSNDNRIRNLREATDTQNKFNRDIRKDNVSGKKGVSWDSRRGMWKAHIRYNKKDHFLGRYYSVMEASAAYDQAAARFHGEYFYKYGQAAAE